MNKQERIRVVLADDCAIIRQKLGRWLADQAGIEVVALAQNAREAIEAIQAHRPAAVILDLRMPDGGGLRVLKEFPAGAWRPVMIVLTNYACSAFRERCLAAGAAYFLDKSTEFDQIAPLLARLFAPGAPPDPPISRLQPNPISNSQGHAHETTPCITR